VIADLLRSQTTPEQRRFIKFCVVGTTGVVVNLSGVWVAQRLLADLELGSRDAFSSACGILISVISNFLLNDVWTWSDREKGARKRDFLGRLGSYCLVSGAAMCIQFITAMGLTFWLATNLYVGQMVGIALGTIVNYIANNRWTFKNRKGISEIAEPSQNSH
jgi:putative flippase GtrA